MSTGAATVRLVVLVSSLAVCAVALLGSAAGYTERSWSIGWGTATIALAVLAAAINRAWLRAAAVLAALVGLWCVLGAVL